MGVTCRCTLTEEVSLLDTNDVMLIMTLCMFYLLIVMGSHGYEHQN